MTRSISAVAELLVINDYRHFTCVKCVYKPLLNIYLYIYYSYGLNRSHQLLDVTTQYTVTCHYTVFKKRATLLRR